MKTTKKRAIAFGAALTAGAGLALVATASPALAAGGTGSQLFTCTNFQSANASDHAGPIKVSVTSNLTSASPAGQTVALTGTVSLSIPTEVIVGLRSQGSATVLGITGARFHLHATNATPATSDLLVTGLTAAQAALPASGPLTFTFPNVSLGSIVTAGTNGGAVALSIDASATDNGFGLQPDGLAAGIPGAANFGYLQTGGATAPHGNCIANADATMNGAGGAALLDFTTADNAPAIGTIDLQAQPPSITTAASYTAIAGQTTALQVQGLDNDGAIDPATWTVSTAPSCTGAGGNGSATIAGTTSTGTVQFTAPNNNATCTLGVTVSDTGTGLTSSEATLTVNVLAGSSLSENVTQNLAPGELTLSACGATNTPSTNTVNPATCFIKMSDSQLNGTNLTSYGFMVGPHAPAPLTAGMAQIAASGALAGALSDNEITIKDNRGAPAPWTLTAQLEGDFTNSNPALTGPNSKIASSNLVLIPVCTNDATNANAPVSTLTAGSPLTSTGSAAPLCSAAAGDNGGSFYLDANLQLTIPQSTYAGAYKSTIDFIVS